MRKMPSALLAVALTPALIAVPTVTAPRAEPRPVAPEVVHLPVNGVDASALAQLARQAPPASAATARPAASGSSAAQLSTGPADAQSGTAQRPAALTAQRRVAPFDLVGVTWTDDGNRAGVTVQVRVREDGRWTGWETLSLPDEGPDAGTDEARNAGRRVGTSPLATEDADGVQVRVDTPTGRPPAGLQVALIDPGQSPADAELDAAPPASSAAAAIAQPTIISRAQWGADESMRGGTSYNRTVKAFVIHHTAGSNSYSRDGAAAQVRGIYAYHTQTLGWSDIGYNFLVDRYGRIYEGRRGSITSAVRGAHAGGFNVDTMGVGAMGNFDVASAPAVMIDALTRVAAWKLSQFDRDPLGKVQLTSAGGGTSKYPKGTVVTKQVLGAHRDFGYTACPGRYIFDQMSSIRSDAAKRISSQPAPTPPPAPPVQAGIVSPSVSAGEVAYGSDADITLRARVKTDQTWKVEIFPMCSSTPVRTLSGSTASSLAATWDLRSGSGADAPPGVYSLRLTSSARSGGAAAVWSTYVEVTPVPGAPAGPCATSRVSGADRYATSVALGRAAYPDSRTIVVASGEQGALADGLVAAPLARAKGGPVLLVRTGSVPGSVAADIARRGARNAYIVGSTTVVGKAVEQQLRDLGVRNIARLGGMDRYGTAAAVARKMGAAGRTAVVASGTSLVDAVAVGGAAARAGRPILLVDDDKVPGATLAAIQDLDITLANVIGSQAVISKDVTAGLGIRRNRYWGDDRYATAAAIATGFAPIAGESTVVVASGEDANIVDGLAGGALGRVAVLVRPKSVPEVAGSWLADADVDRVYVAGGVSAVDTVTMRAVHVAAHAS